MPRNLQRWLCGQFAMGSMLGAVLVAVLFAAGAPIVSLLHHANPDEALGVVVSCFVFYCGAGAALSGFMFTLSDKT